MSLTQIYKQYHEEIQFLSIYIREAHPIDGWWMGRRLTRGLVKRFSPMASLVHYEPKTIEERRAIAGECESALKYGVHTYVDEMDNHVDHLYAAWPTRLYLIDLDGKVVFAGGLGPLEMQPSKLKEAIENYLASLDNRL